MVIDSSLDSWQTACILAALPIEGDGGGGCAAVPGWNLCAGSVGSCSQLQMYAMAGYQGNFVTQLTTLPTWGEGENSAFIHSCHTHCGAMCDSLALDDVGGRWRLGDGRGGAMVRVAGRSLLAIAAVPARGGGGRWLVQPVLPGG